MTERRSGCKATPVAQGTRDRHRLWSEGLPPVSVAFVGEGMVNGTVDELLLLRAVAAGALVALLGIAAGPAALAFLQQRFLEAVKSGSAQLDEMHRAKQATPTMGGLFIVAGIVVGVALLADWHNSYVLLGLAVTVGMAVVGSIDDLIKLRTRAAGLGWRGKLCGQVLVAAVPAFCLYAGGRAATGEPVALLPGAAAFIPAWLIIPWSMFVVVGTANAVNLTDGLDGLAAGCLIFAFAAIAVITCALVEGPARELVIVAAAVVGALVGFLPFNLHPARVFMGNVGALSLGGLLGFLALASGTELLLPIVGGVFVAEAISVILQIGGYKTVGRRLFRCAPLHHHFEFLGWPEPQIVRRLWMAGACCAAVGVGVAMVGRSTVVPAETARVPALVVPDATIRR
jgi:phospho-N-acetylmuramoyl-pentapeptide-transferase